MIMDYASISPIIGASLLMEAKRADDPKTAKFKQMMQAIKGTEDPERLKKAAKFASGVFEKAHKMVLGGKGGVSAKQSRERAKAMKRAALGKLSRLTSPKDAGTAMSEALDPISAVLYGYEVDDVVDVMLEAKDWRQAREASGPDPKKRPGGKKPEWLVRYLEKGSK